MRTQAEAAANPRRGDVWCTKVLRRVVLGKRHGAVVVETSGDGRTTAVESLDRQYFQHWARKATKVTA